MTSIPGSLITLQAVLCAWWFRNLTSWDGWFLPLVTAFYTSQVVIAGFLPSTVLRVTKHNQPKTGNRSRSCFAKMILQAIAMLGPHPLGDINQRRHKATNCHLFGLFGEFGSRSFCWDYSPNNIFFQMHSWKSTNYSHIMIFFIESLWNMILLGWELKGLGYDRPWGFGQWCSGGENL